jgi:hypothetical protein
VTRWPSTSVKESWAPGWGAFLAQDQPRPVWPGGQVDHAGGLGHPGTVAQPVVFDGRVPALVRDQVHNPLDALIDGEAEGKPHPATAAGSGKQVGRPGRVRPGQHPWAGRVTGPRPGISRQLLQGHVQHRHVIGGGVRPGVPGSQQAGQRLPARDLRPVQERQQRVEAKGLLPRGRRVLFLAVRDADRRIEVDPQPNSGIRGCPRLPGTCPRGGPRCPHSGQVGLVDPVRQPPRRRHRRHRAEQRFPVAQHLDPGHRVRSVGDRHRQVSEHLPRQVQRQPPVGVEQRPTHRARQARFPGQLPQQRGPGMRHHAPPVRADLDPARPAATLHPRSAFLSGAIDHSAVRFSLTGKALLRISSPCRPTAVKGRG